MNDHSMILGAAMDAKKETRAKHVKRCEFLLDKLLACAEWHKDAAKDATVGAKNLSDPLMRFAWKHMALEHTKQFQEIHQICGDLRYEI